MQVGTPGPVSAVELADGQIYGRHGCSVRSTMTRSVGAWSAVTR